ncbi:MAG: cysteine-rich CWC family protein [Blastocatellia bacterium]|nr:cysteine-rich CWC family protein [Blastocatellia bacterium]
MNLRRVMGYISPRWREPSTCEACEGPFTCGASLVGCWCLKVKLPDSVREDLRSRYRRCLCRDCLERFAGSNDRGAQS